MVSRERAYAYGAVTISDGQRGSLILPQVNTECMQIFLDETSQWFLMEQAGTKTGNGNAQKQEALAAASLFSGIEPGREFWEEPREKHFHNRVFSSLGVVEAQLFHGLVRLESSPETTQSIAAWPWVINASSIENGNYSASFAGL